jgi:fructose-1,6-bisphosphatase/inositol monophosphatase family enzyme
MHPPVDVLLERLKHVAEGLFSMRDIDPVVLRTKIAAPHHTDPNNQGYAPDMKMQQHAERCMQELAAEYSCEILVLGEETGCYPESLQNEARFVAVVDAIDGTDLMIRGFSNFCLSFVFFEPAERRILLSFVAHASGTLYYATEEGAFQEDAKGVPRRLQLCSTGVRLQDASICFYGQKPRFLLRAMQQQRFMNRLREYEQRMLGGETLGVRLYNFAGNPMLARIPDGAVDVVFEVSGQEVHDVIPGAFIAMQAGAHFVDLQGHPIDPVTALLSPRQRLTYIIGSSRNLVDEMLPLLRE